MSVSATSETPRREQQQACRETIVLDADSIHVPDWVADLESFRRWAATDEFPEKFPRVCYLAGELWIDMSREQVFTHNQVKGEFARVLATLVKEGQFGRFFPDGMLMTHVGANLSCKPDGIFVSHERFEKELVRLVEGAKGGYVELEGSPDMVLEVVSESSVEKDLKTLRELYHRAGVGEYWLVDARKELDFEILRYSSKGYRAIRKSKGWLKSPIFGKSFQLVQETDDLDNPEYTLLAK